MSLSVICLMIIVVGKSINVSEGRGHESNENSTSRNLINRFRDRICKCHIDMLDIIFKLYVEWGSDIVQIDCSKMNSSARIRSWGQFEAKFIDGMDWVS